MKEFFYWFKFGSYHVTLFCVTHFFVILRKKYKMHLQEKQLSILRNDIEQIFSRQVKTPSDFVALSEDIQQKTKQNISTSTLKRLWGYVKSKPSHRIDTLNVLAIYLGYGSWQDYSRNIAEESDFLHSSQVLAQNLTPSDVVDFSWKPNRHCQVVCQNDGTFRVTQAVNCKLKVGDTFKTLGFFHGEPLYITELTHDSNSGLTYVCGRTHGLTNVKVIRAKR